jgi:protein-ribulosamine 3-kinase
MHPLASHRISTRLEEVVSEFVGQEWRVSTFRDMNEFSSHPSAVLSDGSYSVFVKFSGAANALEQFDLELAGLQFLAKRSGVLTPPPIGNVAVEGGVMMVLEAVPTVERTSKQWRELGHTLAQIHAVKGTQFGLETNCYFGPFYQDNRPLSDWPTFYAERRLWPRFVGAINAGNMPTDVIRQVEQLIVRVPQLCGPEVVPTLLHGDSQQHNFISTEQGTVVIDPAVYYGHPEMDLAYIDYFHPVPDEVLIEYRERLPIDPGFAERREFWRIYGYLAIVEVEGAAYLPQLVNAVKKYL